MNYKIIKNCYHADWKTEAVRPRGELKAGTEVKVIEKLTNCYGKYVRVERDDGVYFDIEEDCIEECKN